MREVSICIKLLDEWDSYKDVNPQFLLEDLQEVDFNSTSFCSKIPNRDSENFAVVSLELSDHWGGMNEFEVYQCLKKGEYEGVKFIDIKPYFK